MPPVPTDDLRPARPAWQVLADLAISVAVVLAIALIAGFLAATSRPL